MTPTRKPVWKNQKVVATTVLLIAMVVSYVFSNEVATSATVAPRNLTQLKTDFDAELPKIFGDQGQTGITVKNLKTGETYSRGGNLRFQAASTTKALLGSYVIKRASANAFSLDETLELKSSDIERFGTGSIQNEPPPWRYTYRELLSKMMKESDNTAAKVLGQEVGLDKVEAYAAEIGMQTYTIDANTLTADDMTLLLERIYNREIGDPVLAGEFLELMQDTTTEDRLPALLPKEAAVYHKIGNGDEAVFNDVGIVVRDDLVYSIAVFTRGLPGGTSERRIAEASKLVFDRLTGR